MSLAVHGGLEGAVPPNFIECITEGQWFEHNGIKVKISENYKIHQIFI